uniref:hAT-like transposase RNase-H fold domain-containing protein n=1 Tax=Chenopodium quinoa TaxID=63459 RepID=A0A803MD02_CHEQI
MESGSSGDMEDSWATSQAPPIPSPPPEPWEYDPCPMTENNDPFDKQNTSYQPFEPTDVAAPLSETSKKTRKRRSPHWEHFIKKDGENKAECIYCHTFIGCASLQGRLDLCKFNQEDTTKALTKMVIMDEMSFRMVEHEGVRNFMKCLLEWGISRVMTVTVDNASSNDVGIQYLKRRYELLKSGGVPEPSDWDRVASFLPLLKVFYDATLRVSGSFYIASNVYLPELVGISVLIKKKMLSNDAGVSLMASGMKKKHDKYWENVDNVNLLLYIAVILYPRRKMGYTKWAINQQYDSEKAKYLCDKVM